MVIIIASPRAGGVHRNVKWRRRRRRRGGSKGSEVGRFEGSRDNGRGIVRDREGSCLVPDPVLWFVQYLSRSLTWLLHGLRKHVYCLEEFEAAAEHCLDWAIGTKPGLNPRWKRG